MKIKSVISALCILMLALSTNAVYAKSDSNSKSHGKSASHMSKDANSESSESSNNKKSKAQNDSCVKSGGKSKSKNCKSDE